MSTKKYKKIPGVGIRITQERKRLGYSQAELSAKLGKATLTQISYESDDTRPDADYFFALDELGADIYYIITGRQLEALKAEDELQLLGGYRSCDAPHKSIILNLVEDIAQSGVANNKNVGIKKIAAKSTLPKS